MNPPFPPPPGAFYPNMPPLPLINMTGQFPMPPMGMIPLPVGIPTNQVVASIGITVPTGVTSISAPPVRKITPSVTNITNPVASHHLPQVIKQTFIAQKTKSNYNGPIIPVFVGNINDKASDLVIRQILDKCGNVTNWKRVKGANGKLQAFGFCDYAEADSALRAIRLLHDFEIGDKKLVVKVDAKTKDKLDAYVKERNPKLKCTSDLVTEETKREDENVLNCIKNIINENEVDVSKIEFNEDGFPKLMINNSKTQIPSEPNLQNFSDMDIEDEKKTLIHREIGKFRNTYKKQDEEKEKLEAEKLKERETKKDKSYEKDKDKDRREKDKERIRTPIRESSSRKIDNRYDRDRERDRDRYDRNDRSDRTDRDSSRSNYEDEEFSERRRQERELRKKEQSYQVRLKNWESREERKHRQYEKEKIRAIEKKKEEEKEIKKLKEFLEDYNDDIDDNKYYKGSNLVKKLREREKEKEEDERDRRLEKKELDELRKKLAEEGHPDPESEAKKLMSNVKVTNNGNKVNNLPTNGLLENENNFSQNNSPRNEEIHVKSFTLSKQDSHRQLNTIKGNKNNETVTDTHITPISDFQNIDKKKKFSVHEVFNPNEDDDKSQITKKRKLPVFIDENTDSNQSLTSSLNKNSNDSKVLSSDDKRKQIKALIDNIPTTKEDLFKYEIQWDFVDSALMEKRIRPWINKKITEYIGEEEKALLDFICNKLNARCNAQSILDDVAMVLDDEAEVFIVKMLRLLIYEIEAKKLGIVN